MINKNDRLAIERLTALWALNECGLGGFMHAFSSPFTGIIVGGISILLISLIALHTKNVGSTIFKALSIVLLVKLSVSPHSPITAYVAVSFQAFLGVFLYGLFSVNHITIVLLGAITFLESALQKLLTLTLIYGQSLWDAINIYTAWVSDKLTFLNLEVSSKTLIYIFTIFYMCSGIFVGILIIRILKLMKSVETSQTQNIILKIHETGTVKKQKKRSKKIIFFWSITVILILIPLLLYGSKFGGWKTGVYVLARSLSILIIWYTILGPFLFKSLNKLLTKRKTTYQKDIKNTLNLLPYLKTIVNYSWHDSNSFKGLNRMQHFLAKSIVYSIHFNPSKE